jgi:hypothetical protein
MITSGWFPQATQPFDREFRNSIEFNLTGASDVGELKPAVLYGMEAMKKV